MSFEDSLQIIANMYDKEKAEFTQTANYLLSSTYILREDNKNIKNIFVYRQAF